MIVENILLLFAILRNRINNFMYADRKYRNYIFLNGFNVKGFKLCNNAPKLYLEKTFIHKNIHRSIFNLRLGQTKL